MLFNKRAKFYLKLSDRPIILIEFQTVGRKWAAQGTHTCAAHISILILSGQVAFYYPPAIALAVFPAENALLLQSEIQSANLALWISIGVTRYFGILLQDSSSKHGKMLQYIFLFSQISQFHLVGFSISVQRSLFFLRK